MFHLKLTTILRSVIRLVPRVIICKVSKSFYFHSNWMKPRKSTVYTGHSGKKTTVPVPKFWWQTYKHNSFWQNVLSVEFHSFIQSILRPKFRLITCRNCYCPHKYNLRFEPGNIRFNNYDSIHLYYKFCEHEMGGNGGKGKPHSFEYEVFSMKD